MWETIGRALLPAMSLSSQLLSPLRTRAKSAVAPVGCEPQPATSFEDVDTALETLHRHKDAWMQVSCKDRAALLDVMLFRMGQNIKAASEASVKVKGSYGSGLGEEMSNWLPAAIELADLRQAMLEDGQPQPVSMYKRSNGQQVAKVFPKGALGLLFSGWSTEVWIRQGEEPSQGKLYRDKAAGVEKPGSVALVLGAGNQVPVILADILHKLFHKDQVVLLKMNPINDYFGPFVEAVTQPLVDMGVLHFVYGGLEVGKYLTTHKMVDAIHMTGSVGTFNSIVWGSPVPPATEEPVCPKPVTAELGNVTPFIVVPGPWSTSDMTYYADVLVSGLLNNGGFNCAALQLLITDKAWPLREEFLDLVRAAFNKASQRKPWYPGSAAKLETFKKAFPAAEALGAAPSFEGASPVLLAASLSPEECKVDSENWVPVFQEVAMPGTRGAPDKFLEFAVKFANERCWGNLSVAVLIHPNTQKLHNGAFQKALEELKYGAIAVNGPGTLGYGVPSATWGGYLGGQGNYNLRDIGSGNCYVHNTSLFDHPEKSVVTAPWRVTPKPLWSVNNTNLEVLVPRVMNILYTCNSPFLSLTKLPLTAVSAMLG